MANTFNSGVYPEEWMSKLQERLDKPTTWKDVCDVIFSDVKIFNSQRMSTEFSSSTGTRGTAYSFSDFTISTEPLDIATYKVVPVFIDRANLAQTPYLSQMEFADRQGHLLSDDIETTVLADHGNWTNVGDPGTGIVSGDTTQITVTAANIDNIVRAIRRIINVANGQDLAARNGIFFVWRPADFEFLEEFAQANGFQLADMALKNGIPDAFFFLGCYHYISNSHAANHLFAGVRKIMMVGILRTTWGQIVVTQDPNLQSGMGFIARADYGILTPTGLKSILYDVNVA